MFLKAFNETAETHFPDILTFFAFLNFAARFGHMPEDGDGEDRPPNRHTGETQAHHQLGRVGFGHVGQELRTEEDHGHVDQQQQAAANVTHGITFGRDLIHFIFFGNVRQQSVIKD